MDSVTINELKEIARKIRIGAVEAVYSASSGHPGGSLSIADVLAYLYFFDMNIDPDDPHMEDRDRLVLSKGHACPALYAALALRGFFPYDELKTLRKIDSRLQGHPDMNKVPGIDMSTGSLGQGVSSACGMALAAKIDDSERHIYAIVGDGECEEGEVWESAMFASHYHLDNLTYILDWNKLQIDGKVDDVIGPTPFPEKFNAFGWNVLQADAHDFESIDHAIRSARAFKGSPSVVIASSVKGKGVSFMEDQAGWHGKAPNKEQYETAISELSGKGQL